MAVDVVIVGAGLAGCSAAWHLAPDREVLLLEQGDQPGAEATAQNAGMVRRLGEDPWERALALRTGAWLDDPGPDWPEPPAARVGAVLGLVRDPHHLDDAVAHVRAHGVAVEACPAEAAPALRGTQLSRAWFLPEERVADPDAMLAGYLRGARRSGARLQCRTEVHGLEVAGGRVIGVRTSRGDIAADQVVLAAGAWSAALAAGAGLRRPLVPVRRTLVHTAPHPLAQPGHPWVWLDDVGLYARPESSGWLLSGCDEAPEPAPRGPGSQGPVDPEQRARIWAKLEAWLPALADARPTGGWTGLRTFAPDRRPILGPDPELPGLHWAAGLGGFGVTCSFAVGEAVAAWLCGRTLDWIRPRGVAPDRAYPRKWVLRPTGDLAETRLVDARP